MAELASESDAAIDLVREYYQKLKEKEPQHELLGFVNTDGFTNAFFERYEMRDGVRRMFSAVLAQYAADLKKAVDPSPPPDMLTTQPSYPAEPSPAENFNIPF